MYGNFRGKYRMKNKPIDWLITAVILVIVLGSLGLVFWYFIVQSSPSVIV